MPYYNCKICGCRSDVNPTCNHIKLQKRLFKLIKDCEKSPKDQFELIDKFVADEFTVDLVNAGGVREGQTDLNGSVVEAKILCVNGYTPEAVEMILKDARGMKEVLAARIEDNYVVVKTRAPKSAQDFISHRLSCAYLPRFDLPVIKATDWNDIVAGTDVAENAQVPMFALLKVTPEYRRDGVEHNHIDCVVCGRKNSPTKEYLDLDEHEVDLLSCRQCGTVYSLIAKPWYAPGGAQVYYPRPEKPSHDTALGNSECEAST